MDRTTIMLPPDLKIRASNQAKKRGMSLGRFIRDALENSLDNENSERNAADALFLDSAVFEGKTPKDLSSNHDKYLYGEKR
ncbi:MAG: CopG family transcriptional regulator [Pseudomonadota bacterium]